jgi:HEAT repeat protein
MPAETLERGAFPIIQQFRGKDEYLRGEAELLLSEMGRPAAPSLLPFLADPDADLRRRAVVILGRIGDADNEIIAGLVQRLTDSDRLVRLKAAMALGQLGEADARVLPILLVRLSAAKDPPLRRGLVSAIGNIGPDARDAVGTLIGLLNDSDAGVQEEAAESLMDIGTLEAMDAVERHNRSLKK